MWSGPASGRWPAPGGLASGRCWPRVRLGVLRAVYWMRVTPLPPVATVRVASTTPWTRSCSRAVRLCSPPWGPVASSAAAPVTVTSQPTSSVEPPWPQPFSTLHAGALLTSIVLATRSWPEPALPARSARSPPSAACCRPRRSSSPFTVMSRPAMTWIEPPASLVLTSTRALLLTVASRPASTQMSPPQVSPVGPRPSTVPLTTVEAPRQQRHLPAAAVRRGAVGADAGGAGDGDPHGVAVEADQAAAAAGHERAGRAVGDEGALHDGAGAAEHVDAAAAAGVAAARGVGVGQRDGAVGAQLHEPTVEGAHVELRLDQDVAARAEVDLTAAVRVGSSARPDRAGAGQGDVAGRGQVDQPPAAPSLRNSASRRPPMVMKEPARAMISPPAELPEASMRLPARC